MENIEALAPRKSGKPALRRFAAMLTVLVMGSVLLSACVVYPDEPRAVGYYHDDDDWHHHHHDDEGWHHHDWDH